MAGFEGGYTSSLNSAQDRSHSQAATQYTQALTAQLAQVMQQKRKQDLARQMAGSTLYGMIPPPPGTGGGPQAPNPGEASIQAPPQAQGAPGPVPASAVPPDQMPPYESMPQPLGGMEEQDGIPMPPGEGGAPVEASAPAAAPARSSGPPKMQFNIQGALQTMKEKGVPPEMALDMLDAVAPRLNDQSNFDLKVAHVQNETLRLAVQHAQNEMQKLLKERDLTRKEGADAVRKTDVDSKIADRTRRNDIAERRLKAKLNAAVGGGDKLKRTEFLKDNDGEIYGVVGVTSGGKTVRLDLDGNPMGGGDMRPGPKSGANQRADTRVRISEGTMLTNQADRANAPRIAEINRDVAGRNSGGGAARPIPTPQDKAWVKAHPESKPQYKARFGVDPPQ